MPRLSAGIIGSGLPNELEAPNSDGSAVSEFSEKVKSLAGERLAGDPVKAAIDRAARKAGLTYWRAFDLWYGKARRIEEFERDQINHAYPVDAHRY